MFTALVLVSWLLLGIWVVLFFLRGDFWEARPESVPRRKPPQWPGVVAIIPARNEAQTIAVTVQSLLQQDYPGRLEVIVVDDGSDDNTDQIALDAAAELGCPKRLTVVRNESLPPGWAGKVWAMQQGWKAAQDRHPSFFWFSDADIQHRPPVLRDLVARAMEGNYDLVSLMVWLRCRSFWERFWVPAFIYFFKLLYPFPWANDPLRPTAAAAGGCMLLSASVLEKLEGFERLHNAVIDDCRLADLVKHACGGAIRLDLAMNSRSLRRYAHFHEPFDLVARTAYTQLRHSPLLLLASVLSLALTFVMPVIALLTALIWQRWYGGSSWLWLAWLPAGMAWALQTISFEPVLRYYRRLSLWALALPVIALAYLAATVWSAIRYHLSGGAHWKGRVISAKAADGS